MQANLDWLEQLKDAVDQHNLVATIDAKASITYANPKFCEFFDDTDGSLVGSNLWQLSPKPYRDKYYAEFNKAYEKGLVWKREIRVANSDQTLSWCDLTVMFSCNAEGERIGFVIGTDISEHKHQQEEVVSNNLRLQIANDSAEIGVWEWDLLTNELVWDKWMYALYGITENQFEGVYEAWEHGVHPDDLEYAATMLQDAVDGKGIYNPEFRVVWPSGEIRHLKASAEILRDGQGQAYKVVGVNYDVSDRVEAIELLEAERQKADANTLRMKLANDSAEIGVWEWDLITNELVWDHWMYALYGITENQFEGVYQAWEQGVHPDDLPDAANLLQEAIDGTNTYDPDFRVVWPNGEIRTIKASAEVLRDNNGKAYRVVGVNYDITDRVKAIELLEEAKQQAEQAAKVKSDFLANMSHEIRTPMNGVVGMLQILKHSELNAEQGKQLDVAMSSAQSLLALINDILDFSKIEAGKLEIESIRFDLPQLISNLVEALSHLIPEDHEVNISVDTSALGRQFVIGDPVRLRQVMTNLLSNAIKFTAEGQIVLTAALESASSGEWRFICSVKDTGLGIPESKVHKLFAEFEQADVSTTRKYGGTGLGLSICKKLCELMGGEISVTSDLGKGSCFSFQINLGRCEQSEAAMSVGSSSDETGMLAEDDAQVGSNSRVLLVEDNQVNQLVAVHMLSQIGLEVEVADNGLKAIEMLRGSESESPYSVVLMDCQMPEMDGYEATGLIRDGEAGQDYCQIPIIAMTANAMAGDKEKCLAAGMDDYISKPVEERVIRNTLEKWLNRL